MKLFLILLTALIVHNNAYAQEADNALENYEPPPLFGAPRLPPPKVIKPKIDVIDEISKEVIETKKPRYSKDIEIKRRDVIKEVPETKSAPKAAPQTQSKPQPKPAQKPTSQKPTNAVTPKAPSKNTAPTPEIKLAPLESTLKKPEAPQQKIDKEPSIAPKPKEIKKPDIIKEKAKQDVNVDEPINLLKQDTAPMAPKNTGVVKGPKTMPSYKKKSVESEETFIQENTAPILMLERAVPKNEQTIEDEKETTKTDSAPSTLSNTQTEFSLPYKQAQITPSETDISGTLKPLSKMLAKNNKSIEIKSFASLVDGKLNSDRKTALDRGLKIREFFINNGVEMGRINLRSFGSDTNRTISDSVEITLF